MIFTREPIIESVVSARDGHKIVVRSTKQNAREEYLVDAVEIVSYGPQIFFRNLEKPCPFFLPSSDFSIEEIKSQKVGLKHHIVEKSTKIITTDNKNTDKKEEKTEDTQAKKSKEKKRSKRGKKEKTSMLSKEEETSKNEIQETKDEISYQEKASLLKPPEGLITESLQKYRKQLESEIADIPMAYDETYHVADVSSEEKMEDSQHLQFIDDENTNKNGNGVDLSEQYSTLQDEDAF